MFSIFSIFSRQETTARTDVESKGGTFAGNPGGRFRQFGARHRSLTCCSMYIVLTPRKWSTTHAEVLRCRLNGERTLRPCSVDLLNVPRQRTSVKRRRKIARALQYLKSLAQRKSAPFVHVPRFHPFFLKDVGTISSAYNNSISTTRLILG